MLVTVAASDPDGPMVSGLTAADVVRLASEYATDQAAFLSELLTLVNQDMTAAEVDQPEGTPMQLVITGLTAPVLGSQAGFLATQIQTAFINGEISQDSEVMGPADTWNNSGQLASGDDATATLTLRWIKGQPWGYVLVGVCIVALGVALYFLLTGTPWSLQAAGSSGGGSPGQPSPASFVQWLLRNLWWELPVATGLAVLPWALDRYRRAEDDVTAIKRDYAQT